MKSIPALLSAFVITAMIGVSMLVIGANALFNPRTTVMASSPAAQVDSAAPSGSAADAQTADTQALITQYQDREKQYQQRLDEAVQKLNAANQQIQQANQQIQQDNGQMQQADQTIQTYQNVLTQLQRRGLIRIDQNGQITLGRGSAPVTQSDDH